jgi:hypothetical protein
MHSPELSPDERLLVLVVRELRGTREELDRLLELVATHR